MHFKIIALLIAMAFALAWACSSPHEHPKTPMVITSVVSQRYFVKRIAGDKVDVQVMVPPGASPETYAPTMEQMKALSRASLYVKVGHPHFPFEKAWLQTLIAARRDLAVIDSSQGIETNHEDPHIWVSVKNARIIARNISLALEKIAPQHTKLFEQNLSGFLQDADALDREIRTIFHAAPKKTFYVFHPAWHTFAAEYGLKQVAVENDHKEPSPNEIRNIISQAKADGAKTIFVQPQISRTSAELIAGEIGGEVVTIDPLGGDWIETMRHAAHAIGRALSQ